MILGLITWRKGRKRRHRNHKIRFVHRKTIRHCSQRSKRHIGQVLETHLDRGRQISVHRGRSAKVSGLIHLQIRNMFDKLIRFSTKNRATYPSTSDLVYKWVEQGTRGWFSDEDSNLLKLHKRKRPTQTVANDPLLNTKHFISQSSWNWSGRTETWAWDLMHGRWHVFQWMELHNRRKSIVECQFLLPSVHRSWERHVERIVSIEPGNFIGIFHPAVLTGKEADKSGSF